MIIFMNAISITLDSPKSTVSPLEFYGYILNPATVIFGPFLTYIDYQQIILAHPLVWFFLFFCFI